MLSILPSEVWNTLNLCTYQCKAGGVGGRAWGGDLPSNSLPTGKSFQSNATKFPHPGRQIAIKYPKAEPKKGTMKISPNKTLQYLCINQFHLRPAPPPPRLTSGQWHFFAFDGKFPGVGTFELSNPPGWERKKRANAPSSVNAATFFIDRTVE